MRTSSGAIWLAWQSDRYAPAVNVFYKIQTNGVWSQAVSLTSNGNDTTPALAQLNNGTIFMFWATNVSPTSYAIVYRRFNTGWSALTQLTSVSSVVTDESPAATVAPDGTLWLVWTRASTTCPTCSSTRQLYYMTLKNGLWSPQVQLTSDTNWNWLSSVTVGIDGKVRILWSKGTSGTYKIWSKTYDGPTWGAETQIITSTYSDTHPSIAQDRDGLFWIFWTRAVPVGAFINFDIYSKFSTDNGQTWSADSQMTFDPGGFVYTDEMPAIVQSTYDKSIWAFYTTNVGGKGEFDIYALKSSPVSPIHDVAISKITPSNYFWYQGGLASIGESATVIIGVTVKDLGDFAETVSVSLSVSNITTYNLGVSVTTIPAGGSSVLSFSWNTSGASYGRYSFSATLTPIPGQNVGNTGHDSLSVNNGIRILPLGDVDQDGDVALGDVSVFIYDFGFTPSTPGRWNPFCDINNNGMIDIIDVGVAVKNFGIIS